MVFVTTGYNKQSSFSLPGRWYLNRKENQIKTSWAIQPETKSMANYAELCVVHIESVTASKINVQQHFDSLTVVLRIFFVAYFVEIKDLFKKKWKMTLRIIFQYGPLLSDHYDKKVTFSNGKTDGLFYNEVPIVFQYRVPFLFRRMKCGTTSDKKRISDILLCVQCTLKTRLRCVKKRYHKKTLSK